MLGFIGVSTQELLIIAAIFMLLFGASRLPSLMRNMGRSVGEFKQGLSDEPEKIENQEEGNENPSAEADAAIEKKEEVHS